VAGMRVFQQAFDLTLVQGACQAAGVDTSGDRFEKRLKEEYQRTLDTMNVTGTTTDAAEKEKILNEVLRRQGVTAIEFRMSLETRCLLRALAQGNANITVTDEDVDDAYVAEYGQRRLVHLVQVPDMATAAKFRDALKAQKSKGSADPATAAAAELGLPAPPGWTISSNAKQIKEIHDAAFSQQVGDTNGPVITFQGQQVIVYVDKDEPSKIPAAKDAAAAAKAKVAAELKAKVLEYKQQQWMSSHLANLRAQAVVKINDPVLSRQFEQAFQVMQSQATSQPAAGGTTPIPGSTPGAAAPAAAPARGATPALPSIQGGMAPAKP